MAHSARAVSSKSKLRLQAFQFAEYPKENQTNKAEIRSRGDEEDSRKNPRNATSTNISTQKTGTPSHSQKTASEVHKSPKDCPHTPIGRLPLSELINTSEDAYAQVLSQTPYERVYWNMSPRSSDPSSSAPIPIVRRGQKRAHSSSPNILSPNELSNQFTTAKPALDLGFMQNLLKTPQTDPARDLWARYSTGRNEKETHIGPVECTRKFLKSPSPHAPASQTTGKDNSLRRTMSCGTDWPTSVAKRRRVERRSLQNRAESSSMEMPNVSATSRLSVLLDMVQDRLTMPNITTSCPGSSRSSPPGERVPDAYERHRVSPREFNGEAELVPGEKPEDLSYPQKQLTEAREKGKSQDTDSSSIICDIKRPDRFPYTQEMVNIGIVELSKREPHEGTVQNAADRWRDEMEYEQDGAHVQGFQSSSAAEQLTEVHASSENDEFEEDEIDLFAADLEDVAARYDQEIEPHTNDAGQRALSVEKTLPNPTGSALAADSFGEDDLDLTATELEEAVATFDNAKPCTYNDNARHELLGNLSAHAASCVAPMNTSAGSAYSWSQRTSGVEELVAMSSDEEFGDIDFEQIVEETESPSLGSQVAAQTSSYSKKSGTIQRFLILTVADSQYETDRGHTRPEKVLLVQEEKSKVCKAIILRQSWFDSPCSSKSYVHLIGDFDRTGQCIVDDAHNMLIVHPDHLISATVVADSFSCTRRAVLQDRVKATSDANEPQVYGHILHEIFQEAMKANRWDTEWLAKTVNAIASRYLENLFEINVDLSRAIEHLNSKVPELQVWAELFVSARPKTDAVVKDRNGKHALMSVNKLLDVEEHVWSPMYGLKGNIDATVQVVMKDPQEEVTLTVPFEVKTGRNNTNAAHKAQTALYTLLLSDRYDVEIAYGILYYMETSEISRIPAIRHEIRHMVMQRNELACYVRQRLELPPMLKHPHLCGKCYAKTPCFIYHKLVDNGNGETSGLKEKFDEIVQHLKPVHQEFFKKWDDLLTKEERDLFKFRRELWTMLSLEREKLGRCFGHVIIEPGSAFEMEDAPKINRFRYTFLKERPAVGFSFVESQITIGEPIVISDEKGHFALANGYVTHLRKHRITVAVDRRLHNARTQGKNFDAQRNQTFTGIMEVIGDESERLTATPAQPGEQVLYRLDKDEFSNGMAAVRNSLIRMMEKDLFGAQALRKLIIEGVAPTFRPISSHFSISDTTSQANLNDDQRCAIEKVMAAKDYALVLGMPGTGKTTTIAHIIRALATQGKTILLTSYTHTAVDNILLKIRHDDIGILRLGAVAKVHPEVQGFADLAGVPKTTVEELKQSYDRQVVATTCLGINHPIFNQRIFDYCIVDEASQITLPVCLGPIRMARTFILVGDHNQLPPLVQNKEAQQGGLDISLFKLLSEKQPSSVVSLEHQYRMCEDIMTLSNHLIYNGRLKCGTAAVAQRSLSIPKVSALSLHHHPSPSLPKTPSRRPTTTPNCPFPTSPACWLRHLLSPTIKTCFVNTDSLLPDSRERQQANSTLIINPTEASLCAQLVTALLTTGVPATDIGVITPYRSQLALLKQTLRQHLTHHPMVSPAAVEMHTADRFQGRDKEVIILSLVRSNEKGSVGDLLKDWRRVNVAFTRARTKLLVLGSKSTLRASRNQLLEKFLGLCEERKWCFDLPVGALEMHVFEEGSGTQGGESAVEIGKEEDSYGRSKEGAAGFSPGVGNKVFGGKESGLSSVKKDVKKVVPGKVGKLDGRALLGRRPVLRDIVNEASS